MARGFGVIGESFRSQARRMIRHASKLPYYLSILEIRDLEPSEPCLLRSKNDSPLSAPSATRDNLDGCLRRGRRAARIGIGAGLR